MNLCLSIAGSDPSGGAGIQADIKVFQKHNCHSCSITTLETIQNTLGVKEIFVQNPEIIAKQIECLKEDFTFDAIKLGALGNEIIAKTIIDSAILENTAVIIDPVMISTNGNKLFLNDAVYIYKNLLLKYAALVTPNIDEASLLSGITIHTLEDMKRAAEIILKLECKAVLIKGGHLEGNKCIDLLLTNEGFTEIQNDKINSTSTHGTGCYLSSTITALIAIKTPIKDAVKIACKLTNQAIASAPKIGHGKGPLNFNKIV